MSLPEVRAEIKAIIDDRELDHLLVGIHSHKMGAFQTYPDRWVNNIYFDTVAFSSFVENIEGGKDRTKVRLRWYGDLLETTNANLEVKKKNNHLGTKLQFPCTSRLDLKNGSWNHLIDQIKNGLPAEAAMYLSFFPRPTIINRYYRTYFEDCTRKIRLTIDRNLQFFGQTFNSRPNLENQIQTANFVILEFKYLPENRRLANDTMNDLRIRTSRFSKFVHGTRGHLF